MDRRWIWQLQEWPQFRWDSEVLAGQLGAARKAQGRLSMARDLLDPGMAKEALASLLKMEGISTSAIEGKHLNPDSVAASVAKRLGIPKPPKAPLSLEADGLISVLIDAVEDLQAPLNLEQLLSWQKALLGDGNAGFHKVVTGALRPEEVYVQSGAFGREITHFQGVPKASLEQNVQAFLGWFNESQGQMDGLLRAGLAHLWFITIHPFEDGNGRITRAITDRAIAQDEKSELSLFRMSTRILAVKEGYYSALEVAQSIESGLNITAWHRWFLSQVEAACAGSETTIQNTLAKAKFWARHREHALNERQRKVLNRMLDAGPGGLEGGLTNRKYVRLTQAAQATAYRDMEELLQLGCLVAGPGGGRSTAYHLPWEELFRGGCR